MPAGARADRMSGSMVPCAAGGVTRLMRVDRTCRGALRRQRTCGCGGCCGGLVQLAACRRPAERDSKPISRWERVQAKGAGLASRGSSRQSTHRWQLQLLPGSRLPAAAGQGRCGSWRVGQGELEPVSSERRAGGGGAGREGAQLRWAAVNEDERSWLGPEALHEQPSTFYLHGFEEGQHHSSASPRPSTVNFRYDLQLRTSPVAW